MHLDEAQFAVAKGMAAALVIAVLVFLFAAATTSLNSETADLWARLRIAALSALAPAITLFFCIARLARHRFFSPKDIHGSAQTSGTAAAQVLQSLLQNTLEQSGLALPVYVAVSLLAPGRLLILVPAAAAMFIVGRIFFFVGDAAGAPSRAFGFALTFYPTVMLLLLAVAFGFSSAV